MKKTWWVIGVFSVALLSFLVWQNWSGESDITEAGRTKVRLQLQWFDQAQFAGFYVAEKKGYYQDEGLEIEITPGGYVTNPIQVVLTGNAEIAIVTGNKLLQAAESNYSLVAFGNVFEKSIACFMSKTEDSITTPYDFRGKTVAVYRGYDTEHILYCLLDRLKIERGNVNIVDAGVITPFYKGDVQVWPSYVINEPIRMRSEGTPVSVIQPDAFGVQFYSDTFFSTKAYAEQNRETLKKFIRASARGWSYAVDNVSESVDIMYESRRNLAEGSTRDHQTMMLEVAGQYIRRIHDEASFQMDRRRWESMEESMLAAGIIQKRGFVQNLCDFSLEPEAHANH